MHVCEILDSDLYAHRLIDVIIARRSSMNPDPHIACSLNEGLYHIIVLWEWVLSVLYLQSSHYIFM